MQILSASRKRFHPTSNEREEGESYTIKYQKHKPSGFCFYIKCVDDSLSLGPFVVTKKLEDENLAQKFVEVIEFYVKKIYNREQVPQENEV